MPVDSISVPTVSYKSHEYNGTCDFCGTSLQKSWTGETGDIKETYVNYIEIHNRHCGYGSRYDVGCVFDIFKHVMCDDCYDTIVKPRLIASK